MTRWTLPWLALALLSAGCGESVIESENLDASIAEVRDDLPIEQRGAFDVALTLVRRASAGEVPGTEAFSLQGMSATTVIAAAERIGLRQERALEADAVAAQRELLAAEDQLARLRVVGFLPDQVSDYRMEADLTVRNELEFPVQTAWLLVEVAIPGGASLGGEEFVSFQPPLRPGEERTVRQWISGAAAGSLPVEPPAVARCRFVMVERGGEVVLKAPTAEERSRAETRIAEAERRLAALDSRIAALGPATNP